ncbi:hypothetical protein ACW9HQ_41935 [Nocardia gipuzkoensis]
MTTQRSGGRARPPTVPTAVAVLPRSVASQVISPSAPKTTLATEVPVIRP